jgi:hypothetical protein
MDDPRPTGTADRAQPFAAMGEQRIDQGLIGISRRGMDDEARWQLAQTILPVASRGEA